jgi:hypothetical protein
VNVLWKGAYELQLNLYYSKQNYLRSAASAVMVTTFNFAKRTLDKKVTAFLTELAAND